MCAVTSVGAGDINAFRQGASQVCSDMQQVQRPLMSMRPCLGAEAARRARLCRSRPGLAPWYHARPFTPSRTRAAQRDQAHPQAAVPRRGTAVTSGRRSVLSTAQVAWAEPSVLQVATPRPVKQALVCDLLVHASFFPCEPHAMWTAHPKRCRHALRAATAVVAGVPRPRPSP